MPTLKVFGKVKICMYADDHYPPHFHVVSPDFQVLLRISDLKAIEGDARPAQIAEATKWAGENREALLLSGSS